jgi:hypothetical protein
VVPRLHHHHHGIDAANLLFGAGCSSLILDGSFDRDLILEGQTQVGIVAPTQL